MLSFRKNTYSLHYSYRILEDKIRIFLNNQNSYLKAIKFNPLVPVTKSVQFSLPVVSNSLRSHEPHHTRPPCPLPTTGVHSNSCPLSWWYHPAISSSVIPFFSCPQSLPASGSFQMSQLFAWGGQTIGVSASTSVLPTTEWASIKMTTVLLICHSNPCL